MKADWSHLEQFRKLDGPMASAEGDAFGAFYLKFGRTGIIAIASDGDEEVPWEHVSLRAMDYNGERVPTWAEMCKVKEMFWDDSECVVQYHPPKEDYVNNHPHVLHLWRPKKVELPRPPVMAV